MNKIPTVLVTLKFLRQTTKIMRLFCSLILLYLSGELGVVESSTRLSSVLITAATKAMTNSKQQLFAPEYISEVPSSSQQELQSKPVMGKKADLWIVGCGKLGMIVAKKWLEMYPSAVVVGETISRVNHRAIAQIGAIPRLRSERYVNSNGLFSFVFISLMSTEIVVT